MKLTPKQKAFADYYIETGNATQSAIKAGYSKKTASETGYENLRKPHILEYIESKLEEHEFDVKLRQKQALKYALDVLHEKETEEHAFAVGDESGSRVEVVRLKPKIKDRLEAAKFIVSIASAIEKNRLLNVKLEQEIEKLKAETKKITNNTKNDAPTVVNIIPLERKGDGRDNRFE